VSEEVVRNWVRKAESDLKIGQDEMATEEPATDAVCFHMQQCAEKYLKAFLISHGKEVPRTHSIAALLSECIKIDSAFRTLAEAGADRLTDFAVDIRYGEEFYLPSLSETMESMQLARRVRDFVAKKLLATGFGP
jgi:HEPN domain-containing protein